MNSSGNPSSPTATKSPEYLPMPELLRRMEHRKKITAWRGDIVSYFEERLGIPRNTIDWSLIPEYANHKWDGTPNPLMVMLNALMNRQWCAVEGATGVSKTYIAAGVALWFFECFDRAIVVTTAPKERQLELHIWKNITELLQRVKIGHLGKIVLRMNEGDDGWIIVGFVAGVKATEAATSATKAQGFHAENMLIITEETPGIHNAVMTALKNTSIAPNNLILALGNPDDQQDALHRFAMQPDVVHVRISGFDHPNVVLKNPEFIPGAQTEVGLQRMLGTYWSADNPMYLSRARGICPSQSADALIRLKWCMDARDREPEELGWTPELPWSLGVDVANSIAGDKGAISRGRGMWLETIESFPCPDSNQLGHRIAIMINDIGIDYRNIAIDGNGVGAGTVNTLKEYDYIVEPLTGGSIELPDAVEKFNSLRSQMWWQMRKDLERGRIKLPADDELFADLTAPTYKVKMGKICVEPKDEFKKRLGRSPDKGDSAVAWNWIRAQRINPVWIDPDPDETQHDIVQSYHAPRTRRF